MMMASSPCAVDLAPPGVDVGPGGGERRPLLAHVMGERAAAAGAAGDHDLDAVPGEQADRRLVDLRRQDLLGAAGEQCDALPARALGREDLRPIDRRGRGKRARRQAEHRPQPPRQHGAQRPAAARRRAERGGTGTAGAARSRACRAAALGQRAAVGLLDMAAGVVDQVHVVHARRAGGHAGEAGQAAVDVLDDLRRWPACRSPACP